MFRRFTSKAFVLVVLALFAGAAAAAVVLTFETPSTLKTTATPPPVQFAAGDDAGPSALSDYVPAYSLSANRTHFTTTVRGVPEASVAVGSFVKVRNVDDEARTVTLTTDQVTNTYVTGYTLRIYNATDVLQGTLDFRAASPSASVTIPAGATFNAELEVALASGAGAHNVDFSNAIALSFA